MQRRCDREVRADLTQPVGRAAWAYGQVLFAPLPAWADRWRYAPLPPAILAGIGLGAHLLLLGLGLLALGGALRAWTATERAPGRRGFHALVRPITPPLLILVALVAVWWWVTTPPVVHSVPAQGAIGVPRDTVIRIEMQPQRPWLTFLLGGSSQGINTRYADTGEYIPGSGGGSGDVFHFDPDGLLHPNAPVKITVHRSGERPYTLRFTTAGVDSPTATPMPGFPGPFGPIPTPATPPTATPAPPLTPVVGGGMP